MKRILSLAVISILCQSLCYAADTSKVEVRTSISDGSSVVQESGIVTKTFTTGVRQQQTLTLANGANTITVPANTKGLMLDLTSLDSTSVRSLHLKGVTGDRGISLDSSCPVLLPLSNDVVTNTMIISNDNATSVQIRAYWL